MREIRPPFNPTDAVAECASLQKSYGIGTVIGDNYSAEWVVSAFREHGSTDKVSEKVKSQIYLDFLPLVNAGRVELPDHERGVNQLAGLERRVARSGRDSIMKPDGGHDDVANSIAGVLTLVAGNPVSVGSLITSDVLSAARSFRPSQPMPPMTRPGSTIGDDLLDRARTFGRPTKCFWK